MDRFEKLHGCRENLKSLAIAAVLGVCLLGLSGCAGVSLRSTTDASAITDRPYNIMTDSFEEPPPFGPRGNNAG